METTYGFLVDLCACYTTAAVPPPATTDRKFRFDDHWGGCGGGGADGSVR